MSIFQYMPSLPMVVFGAFMLIPIFSPNAWPLLPILLAFLIWTKFTETIVTTKGNLPSIYHCYYKVFYCCRQRRLAREEKVPKISADAGDVLFSYNSMMDLEVFPDTLVDQSKAHADVAKVIAKSIESVEKPMTTDGKGNVVAAPDQIKYYTAVTASSSRGFPTQFFMVPGFNMDLSVMVFAYFPLPLWGARLVRMDSTVHNTVARECAFSFNTRIAQSTRRDTTVEIDFVTEVLTDADNLLPKDQRPKRGKRDPRSLALIATTVSTYAFPSSAPADSVLPPSPAPMAIPTGDELVSLSYKLPAEATARFANISGNVHPRHLNANVARVFGEKGHELDAMLMSSLLHHTVNAINPQGHAPEPISADSDIALPLQAPFRVILELDAQTAAPANLQVRLDKPCAAPSVPHRGMPEAPESMEAFPAFSQAVYARLTRDGEETVARAAVLFDIVKE